VECSGEGESKEIYRGYHGSALTKDVEATAQSTSPESQKPSLLSKVDHWKSKKELNTSGDNLPPNILLIGQDSTSRLNFRRNMINTMQVLESLGAVEMLGYVKGQCY